MRLTAWTLLALLSLRTFAGEVDELVQKLGSESAASRRAAQETLSAWMETKPRERLVLLAERYSTVEDLEIKVRLEELLADSAREWMFYFPPGFMGINFRLVYLRDDDKAIEILQVLPGGAAERAGLRDGDNILEMNGVDIGEIESQEDFVGAISELRPGELIDLVVQQGDERVAFQFPLGVRAVEHLDIRRFSREEEEKIRKWLRSLRPGPARNPKEPLGHFEAGER